jgi:uncharacterized protein (DUF4415 family)
MRPVQKFSVEYLEQCQKMTPDQIIKFLEGFRLVHAKNGSVRKSRTKLISIKVEEDLLGTFRTQCNILGVPYQTQIKKIMQEWLK